MIETENIDVEAPRRIRRDDTIDTPDGVNLIPMKPIVKTDNWEILNELETDTKFVSVGDLYENILEEKLVSIPEFLQRALLTDKWFANDYQNSKEYITSVWLGQGKIDPFTIVPIKLLILKINEKIEAEHDKIVLESLKDGLTLLEGYIKKGAISAILDGQSRGFLGILEYMNGSFALGSDLAKKIKLGNNGKCKSILAHSIFTELPTKVQDLFKCTLLNVNVVTNFNDFNDVIDSLVSKQKGFSWSKFQIIKQKNRFTNFVNSFINSFKPVVNEKEEIKWDNGSKFTDFYKTLTKNLTEKLKIDKDGQQLFMLQCSYLLKYSEWPTDSELNEFFTSPTKVIEESYNRKVMDYFSDDFFPYIGKQKVTISLMINYLVFRENLSRMTKKNPISERIQFDNDVIIKDQSKLTDRFFKFDLKLSNKKVNNPHPASFVKIDGKWEAFHSGYKHQNSSQSTETIGTRMELFFEHFDFDSMEDEGFITIVENNTMPSKNTLLIDSGFEDINKNEIMISDLHEYDRSHHQSQKNFGTNLKDNLSLEKNGPNRSRGKKNIEP